MEGQDRPRSPLGAHHQGDIRHRLKSQTPISVLPCSAAKGRPGEGVEGRGLGGAGLTYSGVTEVQRRSEGEGAKGMIRAVGFHGRRQGPGHTPRPEHRCGDGRKFSYGGGRV